MDNKIEMLLIDSKKKKISKILIEDSIRKIREIMECNDVSLKIINNKYDLLFDSDTFCKITNKSPLFKVKDDPKPFVGKGIILTKGHKGIYINNEMTDDEAKELIFFFNLFDYNYEAEKKMKKKVNKNKNLKTELA